jgi:hypothetical protein
MWYVRTYVRTFYHVMSQLSDWKRAHMCTENHVCFGRIHGSQLREEANAGQHTPSYRPRTTASTARSTYVRTIIFCHNFVIGKGYTCALRTRVRTVHVYFNVISQLSDWKRVLHVYLVRTYVRPYHGTTTLVEYVPCTWYTCLLPPSYW